MKIILTTMMMVGDNWCQVRSMMMLSITIRMTMMIILMRIIIILTIILMMMAILRPPSRLPKRYVYDDDHDNHYQRNGLDDYDDHNHFQTTFPTTQTVW